MKSTATILESISSLPFIARSDLSSLGIRAKNLEQALYRGTKAHRFHRLKRGYYTTEAYIQSITAKGQLPEYLEFIANILVRPSYITAEYVLAKHELLTETVTTITSYTTNRPTLITNELGSFRYRNVGSSHLGHFTTFQAGPFSIKMASKVQALVDYLYLKKRELKVVSPVTVNELRLNLHLLSQAEIVEAVTLSKIHRSTKLAKIFDIIKELHASK